MMKKKFLTALLITFSLVSCVKDRSFPPLETIYQQPGLPKLDGRSLIHYWNFNVGSSLLVPTTTKGGASLNYVGGSAIADAVTPGTTLNARNSDVAGSALRLRNPAGIFTMNLPTTNYKDIIFSFDLQRSDSGPQLNKISYSLDGTNFINDNLKPAMHKVEVEWQTFTYNFTQITGANNNPNFKIRIEFDINNTGDSGNDRFDNIALDGNIIDPNFGLPELVHYWDFNDANALITPKVSKVNGASLAYVGTWDEYTTGTTINTFNGSAAGSALRLRNPAGTFTIAVPTTNYKSIRLKMAVQRSSSGSSTNTLTYTLDGINYISNGITTNSYTPETDPAYGLVTFDFSSISGINNNPNFKIRIDFSNGNTGSSGNNRFDNISIEGIRL